MRFALAIFLLILSGPLWVVGLVLTPLALARQGCFAACSYVTRQILRNRRTEFVDAKPAYFRRWGQRRKHVNYRRPGGAPWQS